MLPSADLAASLKARLDRNQRVDLRRQGTGNPGGLNAAKVLGTRWGMAVIAADYAKGAAASVIGRRIAGDPGAYAAGAGAVAGHCLPLYNRFRGGKGVATSAGSAAVCFPLYAPVDAALAFSLVRLTRGDADKAVVATSTAFTGAALAWWRGGWRSLWGPRPTWGLPAYAAVTSALVSWRMLSAPMPERVGGDVLASREDVAA